jgi:hypothetical protein
MVRDQLWVWEFFVNRAIRRLLGYQARYGLLAVIAYLVFCLALMTFTALLVMGALELLGVMQDGLLLLFLAPIGFAIVPLFWSSFLLLFEYQLYYGGAYWLLGVKGFPIRESLRAWVQFGEQNS